MTRPPIRKLLAAAALLAVVILAAWNLFFRPVAPPSPGMAQDFRLNTTAAGRVALSDYRGHPVLLNFFTTWCSPCRTELPVIARARLQHPGLVTLLVDERETARSVRAFLRDLHVSQPALLDRDGTVAERYAVSGQPVTIWITPSGRIRAVSRGPIDNWTIDARYQQLTSKT